jgi:hypothetical protein
LAIAFALTRARKPVRGLRQGLTEDKRHLVADDVVQRLQQHDANARFWHKADMSDAASPSTSEAAELELLDCAGGGLMIVASGFGKLE